MIVAIWVVLVIVDIVLTIDGLNLKDETVDEFIDRISAEIDSAYPIIYDVIGMDDG